MTQKILRSAGIAIAGAALATLIMLQPEITDYILNQDPINWAPAINAGFTALTIWVTNVLRVISQGTSNSKKTNK